MKPSLHLSKSAIALLQENSPEVLTVIREHFELAELETMSSLPSGKVAQAAADKLNGCELSSAQDMEWLPVVVETLPVADSIARVKGQDLPQFFCQGQTEEEERTAYSEAARILSEGGTPVLAEIKSEENWLVILLALNHGNGAALGGLLNVYFNT